MIGFYSGTLLSRTQHLLGKFPLTYLRHQTDYFVKFVTLQCCPEQNYNSNYFLDDKKLTCYQMSDSCLMMEYLDSDKISQNELLSTGSTSIVLLPSSEICLG